MTDMTLGVCTRQAVEARDYRIGNLRDMALAQAWLADYGIATTIDGYTMWIQQPDGVRERANLGDVITFDAHGDFAVWTPAAFALRHKRTGAEG